MPTLRNGKATRARKRLITGEELLRHPEWGTCELIDGEVVMLSPAGAGHGQAAMAAAVKINDFVARKRLGVVYAAETGFYLRRNPDKVRAPDCMFISWDRAPAELEMGYLPVVPDLAVEVVDPKDPALTSIEKAQSFVDAGVKLVWVIDYVSRKALVYEQGKPTRMLAEEGVLDGSTVLPGFKLPLKKIWRALEAPKKNPRQIRTATVRERQTKKA
ncbi:MAG TPA: Uma2 family endonuclease [Planctomycetota bacterium]|jgi:Uma2 family endonuclease